MSQPEKNPADLVQSALRIGVDRAGQRKCARHGGIAQRREDHADEADQIGQRHHALGVVPNEAVHREWRDGHHENHAVDHQIPGGQRAAQLFPVTEFFERHEVLQARSSSRSIASLSQVPGAAPMAGHAAANPSYVQWRSTPLIGRNPWLIDTPFIDTISAGTTALPPAVRIAPGESLEFEVSDSSGGQLTPTSTVEDVSRLDFGKINPVTGPVYIDGAQPGDVLKVTLLSFAPSGWGWTANIPGFGLLADEFKDPAAAPVEIRREDARARPVRPLGQGAPEAVHRHHRRGARRARHAQHRAAATRGRQHGRARPVAGDRALPAGRSRRSAVLGRRHACGAGRRRGLRHGHREPDAGRPAVRSDRAIVRSRSRASEPRGP